MVGNIQTIDSKTDQFQYASDRNSRKLTSDGDSDYTGLMRLVYDDGTYYDGSWVNGRRQGYGVQTYFGGGYYTGQWMNDKRHGRGEECFPDGRSYEGDFRFGEKQGKGRERYVSGNVYTGDFERGKKVGRGVIRNATEVIFEGEWKDDMPNPSKSFDEDRYQYDEPVSKFVAPSPAFGLLAFLHQM